jgi:hypothetical protein
MVCARSVLHELILFFLAVSMAPSIFMAVPLTLPPVAYYSFIYCCRLGKRVLDSISPKEHLMRGVPSGLNPSIVIVVCCDE